MFHTTKANNSLPPSQQRGVLGRFSFCKTQVAKQAQVRPAYTNTAYLRQSGASKNVNLFNSGINQNSLAFGNLRMTYKGNNQFSITSNRFDFDYQSNASFGRNAGTFVGGAIFGQFYTIPITPFSILRDVTGFGGSFMINFNGTVIIPK